MVVELIPNTGGSADAGDNTNADAGNDFSVPTEYQEKGWAKDLKNISDVYKKLDGAEVLIGQKPADGIQLPKEGATPDDMASFYGSLGRPSEASEYKFNREGQSEEIKALNSDEMDSTVKSMFHKWGLRPEQATGIQTDYEALLGKIYSEQNDAKQKLDDDFESMTTKVFGNEKETILENAKILLQRHTPEGFGEFIKNDLDNKSLTIMAGVLNDIKSKYISEDSFKNLENDGGGQDNSKVGLRKQGQELMQSKDYTDSFSPKHEEVKAKVAEIYAKLSQMG